MAVERELEVVAMRADVRQPAAQVGCRCASSASASATDELGNRRMRAARARREADAVVHSACAHRLARRCARRASREVIRDALDPGQSRAAHSTRAMLGERWLPHGGARQPQPTSSSARRVAQRGVASHERRAVLLERREVSPRRERERDVEESTPLARRAGDELDVARREHDRRQRAERVAQSGRLDAVDA